MNDEPRRSGRRRWGLRTLAFLVLAAASLLFYNQLREHGLALLTTMGLLVGLVGAAVCTVRGVRSAGLPRSGG